MELHEYLAHTRHTILRALGKSGEPSAWSSLMHQDTAYWQTAKNAARTSPRVLIATSMGGYQHGTLVESALAIALTLRGASVDVMLCDSFLPTCQMTEISSAPPDRLARHKPQPRCDSCEADGNDLFETLGLLIHRYSKLVKPEELKEAKQISSTSYKIRAIHIHRYSIRPNCRR